MRDALGRLGISDISQFGQKYHGTIRDYLSANNCGKVIGYAFTRLPLSQNEVTPAIEFIGEKGIVRVDYALRVLSVGVVHPLPPAKEDPEMGTVDLG